MDPEFLYDSPFTDKTPDGPDEIFGEAEVESFSKRRRQVD